MKLDLFIGDPSITTCIMAMSRWMRHWVLALALRHSSSAARPSQSEIFESHDQVVEFLSRWVFNSLSMYLAHEISNFMTASLKSYQLLDEAVFTEAPIVACPRRFLRRSTRH
jgi:hypothetical protein